MKDQDYQLEEFENAAVNKSNVAKRVAAGAGLVGLGAGAGYAANNLTGDSQAEIPEVLTEEDLESVATTGADQVVEIEEQQVAHVHTPEPEPVVTPPREEEPNITFDKTTQYMQNDQLIVTEVEGTLEGNNFKLIDVDGDLFADAIAYDANGNGIYEDEEFMLLDGNEKVYMGHETPNNETVRIYGDLAYADPFSKEPYDINDDKGFGPNDIHNDFDDEKAGESYYNDYADNNQYYNNNADVDQYSAGIEAPEADLAMIEEDKEGDDFNYLAENDSETDNNSLGDSFDNSQDDSFDIV